MPVALMHKRVEENAGRVKHTNALKGESGEKREKKSEERRRGGRGQGWPRP